MKLTLCIMSLYLGAAFAQNPSEERRLQARKIIDAHYFETKNEFSLAEATKLLGQNIEKNQANVQDYLTLAYAHFIKNDQLGKVRTEEDLGEAQNILSRAKLKFPNRSEITFFSYYYTLFSSDRYKRELAATEMLQSMRLHKTLAPDLLAIYTLSLGAVRDSKVLMQKYLDQHENDPTKRAYFLDLYGNLLIQSKDATLARLCVETYERAITERADVALYYAKAAHCAARGLDFERSHLYFKNAYELMKDTPSYKKTYSSSLIVQFLMKQEVWDAARQLEAVKLAYELSPSKETFAVMLGASLKHEGKDEQLRLLKDGENYFKDNLFEFYQFLYFNQKEEDENNKFRTLVLSKLVELAPTKKHAVLYSYVSFLESITFKENMSYGRDSYALAFKKARSYFNDPEESCSLCQGIMASLYLFQFLQTENVSKLRMSDQIIRKIASDDKNVVVESVQKLLQQITLKLNFREPGLVDRLKSVVGSVFKKYLDLNIFDYTVEKQMYASSDYSQKVSSFQFPEDKKMIVAPKNEEAADAKKDDELEEKNEEAGEAEKQPNFEDKVKASQEKIEELTDVREKLEQAQIFRREKKYNEAITVLKELENNETIKPVVLNLLSDLHHTIKDYNDALVYSERILATTPNDKAALAAKAHLLNDHLKRFESDYDFYQKTSELIPANEDVMGGLAEALYRKGRSFESEYQKVASKIINGKFSAKLRAKTYMNLGNVSLTKQDFNNAIKNYHSCQIISGTNYANTCKNSIRHTCQMTPKDSVVRRLCPSSS